MNKQKSLQVLRFLIGGGVGVLAYYVALYVLTEFCGIWYLTSSIVASFLNFGVSFVLQKFWTFAHTDIKAVPRQLGFYSFFSVALTIGNTLFLYMLVEYVHLGYLLAQIILTFVFTIVSFFVTRRIFAK